MRPSPFKVTELYVLSFDNGRPPTRHSRASLHRVTRQVRQRLQHRGSNGDGRSPAGHSRAFLHRVTRQVHRVRPIAVSGKKWILHVDILKCPRGKFLFSTWGRKNSSEESNETSEEMNHAHVENKKYPRGDLRFSTWIFEKGRSRTKFPRKLEVRD